MKKTLGLAIVMLCLLILTACGAANHPNGSYNSQSISTSQVHVSNDRSKQSNAQSVTSQESTPVDSASTSSITGVSRGLLGKSYRVTPIQYDGEATDKAMTANKAPQNLVHDSAMLIRFDSDSSAMIKGIGSYNPSSSIDYTITKDTIHIANFDIPYTNDGDSVSFGTWT
ncbi:hypothetical protein [Furfurilactobacillus entadae]|uniref:hypothetical protein n=1 Tax=Furfurilactobacillus entadae TaxID=2922307 RepID=UPI0035E75CB2